jgi:hypothetical protein
MRKQMFFSTIMFGHQATAKRLKEVYGDSSVLVPQAKPLSRSNDIEESLPI